VQHKQLFQQALTIYNRPLACSDCGFETCRGGMVCVVR